MHPIEHRLNTQAHVCECVPHTSLVLRFHPQLSHRLDSSLVPAHTELGGTPLHLPALFVSWFCREKNKVL